MILRKIIQEILKSALKNFEMHVKNHENQNKNLIADNIKLKAGIDRAEKETQR